MFAKLNLLNIIMFTLQEEFTMSKRQKKKAPVVEKVPAPDTEARTEYIYEDTQCVTGVEPECKWGEIYRLISRREVPDMGLEEAPIYTNIEKSAIMKVGTRPELFPCPEVMRWVLPNTNHNSMLMCNVDGQGYATFSPGYVALPSAGASDFPDK